MVPNGLSVCTEIQAGPSSRVPDVGWCLPLAETHSCLLIHSQQTLRFNDWFNLLFYIITSFLCLRCCTLINTKLLLKERDDR